MDRGVCSIHARKGAARYYRRLSSGRARMKHMRPGRCPTCVSLGGVNRFAERDLWNIDATAISFQLDVCRLDDWCPASNLALHQSGERWLAAPRLVWNVTADFRQPPAHVLVVEGPVEGVGEPIKDWLRRSLGRKQGPPGHGLEFRQSGFLRGRDIR